MIRIFGNSLNKSKHIDGRPNLALIGRLSRMRNWIDGVHFPENAKINIQEQMNDEDKEKITKEQRRFLSSLLIKLESCPWNESQISQLIRETATELEISPREGYIALYLLIIGRDYGPRIASIIVELGESRNHQNILKIAFNRSEENFGSKTGRPCS